MWRAISKRERAGKREKRGGRRLLARQCVFLADATAGLCWQHLFHSVDPRPLPVRPSDARTTTARWRGATGVSCCWLSIPANRWAARYTIVYCITLHGTVYNVDKGMRMRCNREEGREVSGGGEG